MWSERIISLDIFSKLHFSKLCKADSIEDKIRALIFVYNNSANTIFIIWKAEIKAETKNGFYFNNFNPSNPSIHQWL